MPRICFTGRIRPDRLAEYRARHERVWPEMLEALHRSGWHNYSLFLTPDGLLIGYLETENFVEAQAAMAATEVNARWQAEMAEFFETNDPFVPVEEVFNLDDQRKRAEES